MTTMTEESVEVEEVEASQLKQSLIKRVFWLLLIVVSSVIGYFQFTNVNVLPIQKVEITGKFSQLSSKDFQAVIKTGIEGNFFTINVADLNQRLLNMPWVEKAWIHRVWPDTIRIDIQEQQPVAILKDTGLLNLDGKVFTRNTTSYKEILPVFVVAKGYAPEAVKQYKKNKDILQKDGLQVRIYYYDERKSQSIRLTNGIELVLGRKDVEDRLQKFVKAYDAYLKHDKAIKKIDLRYTNGLAVSRMKTMAQVRKTSGRFETNSKRVI